MVIPFLKLLQLFQKINLLFPRKSGNIELNREFPMLLVKMAPALMLKAAHVPIYALISNAISSFVKSVTSVKAFVLISSFIYVSDYEGLPMYAMAVIPVNTVASL